MDKIVTQVYWTNDHNWLKAVGDECWECICTHAPIGRPFTIKDILPHWQADMGSLDDETARRQLRLVLNNVLAQNEERTDFVRIGNSYQFTKAD